MRVYEESDFGNLPPGLDLLFKSAGEASFFQQKAWYELVAAHAREDNSVARIYVRGSSHDAALVMRVDARWLNGMSNAFTMEYGPLIASAGNPDIVRQLAAEIGRQRPPKDAIRLTALDPKDESWSALIDGLRSARLVVRPFFDSGTWFEDTRGLDFDRYYERRPSILKNTFARRVRIERQGHTEYRFSAPNCDIEPLIADYEEVYRRSWKEPRS